MLLHPHPYVSVHDLLFPKQNIIRVGLYVSLPMNVTLMDLCGLMLEVSPAASRHKTPTT